MALPTIDPTGAMASGDYVTYMIGYLDESITYLEGEIVKYTGEYTAASWDTEWDKSLIGLETKITALNADIVTLKAQTNMIETATDNL